MEHLPNSVGVIELPERNNNGHIRVMVVRVLGWGKGRGESGMKAMKTFITTYESAF